MTEELTKSQELIARRKAVRQLAADAPTRVVNLGNGKVFAFLRLADEGPLLGLFNMTESWTSVSASVLRGLGILELRDLLGEGILTPDSDAVPVAPYGRMWLV